ncbi:hypothetical protein GCM10009662_18460 [Catellatospora coxensis]|uniref:Uncharacterized protein n=1 Tax=Catellatospora coxensis TaxID=310354 RepID=A0A8J3KZ11_9ACTN|nr:hypothetical protein Cco03nite_61700 [Catellatospora coxensis]
MLARPPRPQRARPLHPRRRAKIAVSGQPVRNPLPSRSLGPKTAIFAKPEVKKGTFLYGKRWQGALPILAERGGVEMRRGRPPTPWSRGPPSSGHSRREG